MVGGGHTIGQVIAKSFSSNRETHFNLFPSDGLRARARRRPRATPTSRSPRPRPPRTRTAVTSSPTRCSSRTSATARPPAWSSRTCCRPASPSTPPSAPCTFSSAGTVTCNLGTLAPHASTTLWIKVVANPVAAPARSSHPQAHHWLTPYKDEQQVDLEPGEQKSVTAQLQPRRHPQRRSVPHRPRRPGHRHHRRRRHDPELAADRPRPRAPGRASSATTPPAGRRPRRSSSACRRRPRRRDRQTGYDDSHKHPLSADPDAGDVHRRRTPPAAHRPRSPARPAPSRSRPASTRRPVASCWPARSTTTPTRATGCSRSTSTRRPTVTLSVALPADHGRPGPRPHPRAAVHPRREDLHGQRPHRPRRATSSR